MVMFQILMNLRASVVLNTFIFALTLALLLSATTPSQNFTIAKPNCVDRCGNISIPFPFGTTERCSQHPYFQVICNYAYKTPKLFWGDTSIEFTDISLDGQLKLLQFVAQDCYARDGTRINNNSPWMWVAYQYFRVNSFANKFTIVGCDAYGYVSGKRNDRNYTTGCTALCDAKEDLMEKSCKGVGCCQTSIPENVWKVEVELHSFWNHSRVWEFNNCSYAFVAEESAFNFSSESLINLMNVEKLPVAVDWVIGNETCNEAKKNHTTYACVSPNSECYEPEKGYGYRCRCNEGYEGNPYLTNGCRDIDECADINLNKCMKIAHCKNIPGNYTCSCPKGYSGDGRDPDGCTDMNCFKFSSNTSTNIDECADSTLNDCVKNEYCTNTAGNYTCSCPKEYSGDGRHPDGCTKKKDMKIAYVLIGIAFGIIALLLVTILLYLGLKRRSSKRTKEKFFLQNGGILLTEKLSRRERSSDMVRIFSSSELQKATNDFHSNMIVGQGGFGTVYKGFLPDNRIVAIKRSKIVDPNQIEQFINEVFVVSQLNHRNVVRLLGCCLETEAPLLVYEFISNGTLSAHIHNQAKARFLSWETRLKIATETAGVLSYLHSATSTPIIHRDIKSDNILLDHTFTAKVADFGASRLVPLDQTQLSTVVQGTLGYLDPEYLQTHQLTEKSDVYSFGVVLVELLTGRKAISYDRPEVERNLVNFFLSMVRQKRLFEILDDNIVGDGNIEQILEVAGHAQGCLNVKGEDRPSMKEVAMELEGLIITRKHSWAKNEENAEEVESLLGEGGLKGFTIGEGTGTSVGYDSIRGHVLLPVSGGR